MSFLMRNLLRKMRRNRMNNAEQFQELFTGLQRGYGILHADGTTYKYVKGQPTPELYQQHLEGKISLGIVPITDTGNCKFEAIDFDDHKKDKNNKKTDKVLQVFQVDTDDGKRYYAKEKGEYSNKYDSMLEFQMTNKIYRNKADSLSTDDFKYLLKKKKYPKKKK